jgi:hypothetical protein
MGIAFATLYRMALRPAEADQGNPTSGAAYNMVARRRTIKMGAGISALPGRASLPPGKAQC